MADNQVMPTVQRTSRGLSIQGTRVTLYDVMDYLTGDWPPALIQQWLRLSDEQMGDVMQYITAHRDEVEAEYQLVVQQAEEARAYWQERNRERHADIAGLPPKSGQEAAIAKLRCSKAEPGLA